ncbi:MAG: hypothetical protein AAF682_13945 [Planctomycetota bacterium]
MHPIPALLFVPLLSGAAAGPHPSYPLSAAVPEPIPGARQDQFGPAPLGFRPPLSVEFALSGDSAWLAARHRFDQGEGFGSVGLLFNDEDDYALAGQLMRFGQPESDLPIELGVGVGLYLISVDKPDSSAYAVSLNGSASYSIPAEFPTTFSLQLALAPKITSFSDGEGLLDLLARVEFELSEYATGFLGFRLFEVDLDDESGYELDDQVHLGVRVGI